MDAYSELADTVDAARDAVTGWDAQIAAICRSWGAGLATRNIDDFVDTGVDAVNPWDTSR